MRTFSFRERMREEAARAAAAEAADPWRLTLERVRGKVDFSDRLERISSQTLLDLLEVPQRNRTVGTFRRVCRIDGRAWLECSPPPRPDARRIQRASEGLLPRRSETLVDS